MSKCIGAFACGEIERTERKSIGDTIIFGERTNTVTRIDWNEMHAVGTYLSQTNREN